MSRTYGHIGRGFCTYCRKRDCWEAANNGKKALCKLKWTKEHDERKRIQKMCRSVVKTQMAPELD